MCSDHLRNELLLFCKRHALHRLIELQLLCVRYGLSNIVELLLKLLTMDHILRHHLLFCLLQIPLLLLDIHRLYDWLDLRSDFSQSRMCCGKLRSFETFYTLEWLQVSQSCIEWHHSLLVLAEHITSGKCLNLTQELSCLRPQYLHQACLTALSFHFRWTIYPYHLSVSKLINYIK